MSAGSDIRVVGTGPVGLGLALQAADHGAAVRAALGAVRRPWAEEEEEQL